MTGRRASINAIAARLTVLAAILAWVLGTAAQATVPSEMIGGPQAFWPEVATSLSFLTYAIFGAFIVARSGAQAVGWVFVAMGCAYQIRTVALGLIHRAVFVDPSGLPLAEAMGWTANLWTVSFGLVPLLFVIFPTGRLPSPRWRVLALALVPATLMGAARSSLEVGGRQFAIDVDRQLLDALGPSVRMFYDLVADWLFLVLFIPSVGVLVRRLRTSHGVERQQSAWFAYACVVLVGTVLGLTVVFVAIGPEAAGVSYPLALMYGIPAAAALTALPVAAAIAIVRHRLFDIDRIISRTVSWAIVTGTLATIFGAAVLTLQALLADVTQGETLAVAASTLVAFAMFQPLRRRVQTAVDHRFDRARYDSERTAVDFAERLRGQVDLDELQSDVATTAATALRPTAVGIWMRQVVGRR